MLTDSNTVFTYTEEGSFGTESSHHWHAGAIRKPKEHKGVLKKNAFPPLTFVL